MLKKIYFILILTFSVAGGLFMLNNQNKALAISRNWACQWNSADVIDCHKPSGITQGIYDGIKAAESWSANNNPFNGTGQSTSGFSDWITGVETSYNSAACVPGGDICNKFYYQAEASFKNGYPVYCHTGSGSTFINGGDEGCLHFFNTLNPVLPWHTSNDSKVINPIDPGEQDNPNFWRVGKIENASEQSGNACSYLLPTKCDIHNDGTYNGKPLDAAAINNFKQSISSAQAIKSLKNACEGKAPLDFITCPIYKGVTNSIAGLIGNDDSTGTRKGLLISFLTFEPLQTGVNGQSALQQIVNNVVGLANLFYIVIFLVLIFSSSLPFGLDNYTIKKTLPKFIGAVIMTQFAYLICGLIIDFFNLLGSLVPNIIFGLQNITSVVSLPSTSGGSTLALQAGLGITVGAGFAAAGVIVSSIGWFLLMVIAIAALLGLLVAFVFIVLRYLVLYILVLLSPIAFAAWVLPGTEKFFKLWWKNFIRLNAMFPMITGLLAVSILVSRLIVANQLSGNTGGALTLLGMLIPIVALLAIPKTLKWTTDGMSALASGTLNLAGKGGKAAINRARPTVTKTANEQRQKQASIQFGQGRKLRAAVIAGNLPTQKGILKTSRGAAAYQEELAKNNRASLNMVGTNLQGITSRNNVRGQLSALGLRGRALDTQTQLIEQAFAANSDLQNGGDIYSAELQTVAQGGRSSILGTSGSSADMQVAAVSELAQKGDFSSIHKAVNSSGSTLTQDKLVRGLQPNFADAMTKAPDLIKGEVGAFDKISAEKFVQLDKDTVERFIQYASQPTSTVARDTLAQIHDEFYAPGSTLSSRLDPKARDALNNASSQLGGLRF